MARDKQRRGLFKTNKKIRNNLELLDNSLKDLYQTTYSDPRSNLDNAEKLRDDIDKHIDDIMSSTYTGSSIGNLTKLYTKMALKKAQSDKDIISSIEDAFNDESMSANILSIWMENKWIRDFEYEIDMILKYMPKLREALACKKDLVLSADHFSKDFINYHNIASKGREEVFNERMEEIKRVYKLDEMYDKWYDHASKYGESFVYVAPYSREFEKVLRARQNNNQFQTMGEMSLVESGVYKSHIMNSSQANELTSILREMGFNGNVKVTFNNSGLLESAAREISTIREAYDAGKNVKSLKEIYTESFVIEASDRNKIQDHLIPDDLEFPKEDESSYANDMLINPNERNKSKEKITVPGCIVKMLDNANIIPIYVEEVCLGYYYIEFVEKDIAFDDVNSFGYTTSLNGMGNSGRLARNIDKMQQQNRDKVISAISKQLADVIDANFINNNQDLRKELFQILKHTNMLENPTNSVNGDISITFLSAEDVTHIYFEQDPITKRGISDLAYSLFPAKLYSCLYITNVLGQITRGQDKRVYYVRQNVESNISKTLLNVINQIKRGNFGARQMENLGNILNITGKFNDYLIPLSPSGDAPVQFDVMPGQQFTDNSELMNVLEKNAIDPTGIPYDLIEARQSLDYAIQATMSNSKLMRSTYNRQDITEGFFSEISSKIYNYEYDENERIEIDLPAPAFLNVTNGSQLISGTTDYINTIIQNDLTGETEEVQNEFRKLAIRYYIPTHLNSAENDKLLKRAQMNVAMRRSQEQEEQ